MRGFFAVTRREIAERTPVLLAAAVAGAVPFLVPLARGMRGADAADARQWTALILAVSFGAGVAIALGLTTLGGEIASRRIGFYWARPISGLSLWAGKLTGVWILAAVAALLAFLPSLAVDGVRLLPGDLPAVGPELLFLAVFGIVALGHVAGVIARSRSPLLLLDVAALGLAYAATMAMNLPLMRLYAPSAALINLRIFEAFLGIGALAGGAAAVLSGRTQIRRAHRALSVTLWSLVAAGLAIAAAHSAWVRTATPSSISAIYSLDPGNSRGWVTVMGPARSDAAAFAFDVNGGRFARVPAGFRPVVYSRSGNRAVWFQADARDAVSVIAWNLDEAGSRPAPTRLELRLFPPFASLSDDGSRLAVYDYDLLSVYDLASGALLGSARVPGRLWAGKCMGLFIAPGRYRMFLPEGESSTRIAILEFDVEARRLRRTGAVTGVRLDPFFTLSPDGNRLIVRDLGAEQVALFDGETGRREMILLDERRLGPIAACFLPEGRIAASAAGGSRIRIVTPDGQIERELGVPSPVFAILGAPVEGRLSLLLQAGTVGILDLASGKLDELAGLRPIPPSFWNEHSDPSAPGDQFSMLFSALDGALVKVDPVSLERRVVLGRAAPRLAR